MVRTQTIVYTLPRGPTGGQAGLSGQFARCAMTLNQRMQGRRIIDEEDDIPVADVKEAADASNPYHCSLALCNRILACFHPIIGKAKASQVFCRELDDEGSGDTPRLATRGTCVGINCQAS